MTGYVRGLLGQFPCMRMEQAANRDELIRQSGGSVDGVIYHTVQFCDNYAYEYAWIKEWMDRPNAFAGNRLHPSEQRSDPDADRGVFGIFAVRERISNTNEVHATMEKNKPMYVMGIDSGSTSTNAVIMDQNKNIRAFAVVRTGAKSGDSADKVYGEVLDQPVLRQKIFHGSYRRDMAVSAFPLPTRILRRSAVTAREPIILIRK